MAKIVLGLATSRSPMLSIPLGLWSLFSDEDPKSNRILGRDGKQIAYQDLLDQAGDTMADQLLPETWHAKYEAAQAGLNRVRNKLHEVSPDITLIIADDEGDWIFDTNRPAFLVYWGDTVKVVPRKTNAQSSPLNKASVWSWGAKEMELPVASDMSRHIIGFLMDRGIEVAASNRIPPGYGIGHGFGFTYQRLMGEKITPSVPIVLNNHFPPNQPIPSRCYELGLEIRNAIESMPEELNVAVIATGGLSTPVLDEEVDRHLLSVLQEKNVQAIAELPFEWLRGGRGEMRNWICAAGIASGLDMEIIDYIPAYRTAAGTGCGLGFAEWC